jgi:hypothetical protein
MQSWRSGTLASDPYGASFEDYRSYCQLAASPDATAAERTESKSKAAFMLRVRFYEKVGKAFMQEHGERIKNACAKVGVDLPDFATLSRKDALDFIAQNKGKLTAVDAGLDRVLSGFAALSEDVVKEEWCHR